MMKKGLFFITLLLIGVYSYGQFTLTGEVRPRFEYRHGFKSVADSAQDHAAFVEQRTRLNFGYKSEGYIFNVVVQDVHVWGSQPQLISTYSSLNADGSYFSVHEAWGEALLSENWSFKFGRQEINLDDHRIFGNVGWTAQARSHDVAMLKFKKNKLQVQAALAYNQDKAALAKTEAQFGSYKAFQYLWLHNDFGENLGLSVLFLNNGKEQLDYDSSGTASPGVAYYTDNYSQTVGGRLTYKKDKLSVAAAFYNQMGVDGNRSVYFQDWKGEYEKEIAAMNYALDVNYQITEKISAGAGYEFMSGNDQTDTSSAYTRVNHAFNPFYGTNHKFNGLMDYFYVGNHAGSVGLQDIHFNVKFDSKSDSKFWINAAAHLFSAPGEVWDGFAYNTDLTAANDQLANATTQAQIDAANAEITRVQDAKYLDYTMNASLGTEIDLTFGFNLSKGVVLQGGYSMMMATETLAYLKGTVDYQGQGRVDQTSNWAWVMLVLKPDFLAKDKSE